MNEREQLIADIASTDRMTMYKDEAKINPTVWQLYNEFIATGQYPYLRSVADYIIQKHLLELTEENRNKLETHIYCSSKRLDRERKMKNREEMIAGGWKLFSEEEVRKLRGRKVQIQYTATLDMFTTKIDKVYTVLIDGAGKLFLMPPRSRTRGLAAWSLLSGERDAFYKIAA